MSCIRHESQCGLGDKGVMQQPPLLPTLAFSFRQDFLEFFKISALLLFTIKFRLSILAIIS